MLDIRPIITPADRRAFLHFPWTLYHDDANWVPPLVSAWRRQLWHSASWGYLHGERYGAWRDGEIVGTVTAFINPRHNHRWNENIAWFGSFECIDDTEVANALLGAAVEWAREQGCTGIRGPQTFTGHEECGVLVEGFSRPVVLMGYNPPYYASLVEGAGFVPSMDLHSFLIDRTDVTTRASDERLAKLSAWSLRADDIEVFTAEQVGKKAFFDAASEIYASAWSKNWGFVPLTDAEYRALVTEVGHFVHAKMAFLVMVEGAPAGFILAIPDLNEVLHLAQPRPGKPDALTLARILWRWHVSRSFTWARIPLMGVRAEYRHRGVDAVLYAHLMRTLVSSGYQQVDFGWVLACNHDMMSSAHSFGARPYKVHRFYERSL